jgi:hypothetical protein
MIAIGLLFLRMLCDCFKPQQRLEAEILVLRHQLNVLQQRTPRRRLYLRWADRALFIWLYRRCPRILDAITIVKPETVVRWHRKGLAAYWRWKSLSLPKTKSGRIDGATRPGSAARLCLQTVRLAVCKARPSQAKHAFASHYNRLHISRE